jgi:hypothetical protein
VGTAPAEASSAVQLGVGNTETSATVIRNSSTGSGSIGTVTRAAASGGIGLQGIAEGSNGKGVYGYAATGSGAMGVYGAAAQGHGVRGYGVIGVVGSGTAWGVYGNSAATNGIGVNAIASGTNAIGLNANAPGSGAIGVQATAGLNGIGLNASVPTGTGTGVLTTGGDTGVHVKSAGTYAFYNDVGPTYGAFAHGSFSGGNFYGGTYGAYCEGTNYGLYGGALGTSGGTYGLYGTAYQSPSGTGVYGGGTGTGVWGEGPVGVHGGSQGTGVQGGDSSYGANTGVAGYGSAYGVYASTNVGWGVWCQGDMEVTGTVNPTAVVQLIDHPQDPEHKWLSHALIAAPEPLNFYRGTVTLDAAGGATVKLPGYFSSFNRDASYQLTAIGAPAPNLYVAQEVTGNRFRIAGGIPGQKVSWLIAGVRQDAYAEAHPLRVETRKSRKDLGTLMFVPKGSNAKPMQVGPKAVAVPRHHPLPRTPRPPVPTR